MRRLICILAVGPVLALAACGGSSGGDPAPASAATATPTEAAAPAETAAPAKGATTKVAIQGFAFGPRTVKVKVGDTIAWTNDDSAPHTVTAKSGGDLDSGTLAQGADFEFTASQPGTIQYFCSIHPDMTGTIEVAG
jgi:plastocyanin